MAFDLSGSLSEAVSKLFNIQTLSPELTANIPVTATANVSANTSSKKSIKINAPQINYSPQSTYSPVNNQSWQFFFNSPSASASSGSASGASPSLSPALTQTISPYQGGDTQSPSVPLDFSALTGLGSGTIGWVLIGAAVIVGGYLLYKEAKKK